MLRMVSDVRQTHETAEFYFETMKADFWSLFKAAM